MYVKWGNLPGSALSLLLLSTSAAWGQVQPTLGELSLEQLGDVEVTSVSRAPQALSTAPAAIYVISQDDIRRSGAQTVPEMLELAPNLEVFQTGASDYVITARGFSGNADAQAFSNKLLVLIDGRSVYTPLFSGVYWDMQQVLPENVERIEVISGPGATLWGANAVNGVINIITRDSAETQGQSATLVGGSRTQALALQYGGRLSESFAYRLYGQGLWQGESELANGDGAGDAWRRPQAGFRLDWTPPGADVFMVSGDLFRGSINQAGAGDENIVGRNVLGRWSHRGDGGSHLQVQAYYDYTERETEDGGGRFRLDTYDIDVQYGFGWGEEHDVVVGANARFGDYRINGNGALEFDPSSRTLRLASAFIQDTITLGARTRLTLGVKAEDGPYDGVEYMPSARLSWSPSNDLLVWAAASRAVRAPTPFDVDVRQSIGGVLFLTGNADFQNEEVVAYELGVRLQPTSNSTLSLSAFHTEYTDLRSIEIDPINFLPLRWGNGMQGSTQGVEIWGDVALTSWWRLSGSYVWYDQDLEFKPSSSGLLGVAQAGSDPPHRASLTSSMDIGRINLDAHLRYVDELEYSQVPSYLELNGRLAWRFNEHAEFALIGRNLLDERHLEFAPGATYAAREVSLELRLKN